VISEWKQAMKTAREALGTSSGIWAGGECDCARCKEERDVARAILQARAEALEKAATELSVFGTSRRWPEDLRERAAQYERAARDGNC